MAGSALDEYQKNPEKLILEKNKQNKQSQKTP